MNCYKFYSLYTGWIDLKEKLVFGYSRESQSVFEITSWILQLYPPLTDSYCEIYKQSYRYYHFLDSFEEWLYIYLNPINQKWKSIRRRNNEGANHDIGVTKLNSVVSFVLIFRLPVILYFQNVVTNQMFIWVRFGDAGKLQIK